MNRKIIKSLVDKKISSSIEYNPRLVVNEGSKNIKTTIIDNLRNTNRFDIAVSYVVWSGLSLLKDELKRFDSKSRFLLTSEGLVTDPNSLYQLLDLDIEVKVYDPYSNGRGFHLKSYLFEKDDETTLLVGSNNISLRALGDVHEMAVELESSKEGYIIEKYSDTFEEIWNHHASIPLTKEFIESYEQIFNMKRDMNDTYTQYQLDGNKIRPNYMQKMALIELEMTRQEHNRGLVIAATGTGKTYLSAFDVEASGAKKVLFLVHNRLILKDAIQTFKRVFRNMNFLELDGSNINKIEDADFIFTTDKTAYIHLLNKYAEDYFDYIIFDEAHKIGESTQYNSLINYFQPDFILGITATPERTDNPRFLFETFNYNVPYEIRLLDAMNSELVCPFNYYGYNLEEKLLMDNEKFNYKELVSYLKEIINDKGHHGSKLKGLVFASNVEEANTLKNEFNQIGINTESAVSGGATQEEIGDFIDSLKSNEKGSLELITTVNKFNEGIDIPEVNVIIMLRNTTSSIIYLQQLGRGLRRTNDPDKFVTVIDIIGNSNNNYTIAEVLTGNETRDKRTLLKHVNSSFNEVSPFINVEIEEKAMEKIIRSITNDFKVETQLKRKFTNELQRFKTMPSLLELYLNPNFKELDLLQLLFKNFHTPFAKEYKEKYNIEEDNLFVKNFFIFISQFVFRGYNSKTLFEYVKVLNGGTTSDVTLMKVLLAPTDVEDKISTAIFSNYYKVANGYPVVFEKINNELRLSKQIIPYLIQENSYDLFLEHVELFKYLIDRDDYVMDNFALIDKAEFLFNNGAQDAYMNVVGERISHKDKKIYCTINITEGHSHYDNRIEGLNKVVYHTQKNRTSDAANDKKRMLIDEGYEFVVCAKFPHLGYSNTSYFNLGPVSFTEESFSEIKKISDKEYNHEVTLTLSEDIPIEFLMYKGN